MIILKTEKHIYINNGIDEFVGKHKYTQAN